MVEFAHGFWSPVIAGVTLVSLVALAALVWSQGSKGDPTGPKSHVWDEDLRELDTPLPAWWRNMFYITLLFALVYVLLYPGLGAYPSLLGWSQLGQYEEEVAKAEAQFGPQFERYASIEVHNLANDPKAVRMGERLFASYCTTCHGSDARGAPGFPNLRDRDWLWGGDPKAITASILDGRTGVMPPWGAALGSKEAVHEVGQYVLSLSGRTVNLDAANRGAPRYAQFCVACHGPEGKGNVALGAPNLSDGIWLHGSAPAVVESVIADGRQGHMPAHRELIGPNKAHLITGYLYSLTR